MFNNAYLSLYPLYLHRKRVVSAKPRFAEKENDVSVGSNGSSPMRKS